jgi:hypothetical protein
VYKIPLSVPFSGKLSRELFACFTILYEYAHGVEKSLTAVNSSSSYLRRKLSRHNSCYFQTNWICGLKDHPVALVLMMSWTIVVLAVSAMDVNAELQILNDVDNVG